MKVAVLMLACASLGQAVELHVQFGALERMLSEQVFTQDGRRYVHGTKATKCNFAYMEKPRIRGEGGLLRIQAHFTGRAALNVIGQCVGLGDAFDLVVTALPIYKSGWLELQEVKVVSTGKNSYYIRKVCEAMQASLRKDFRYPLQQDAEGILQSPGAQPQYKREVRKFNVTDIRVTNDALVLSLDFEMTLR